MICVECNFWKMTLRLSQKLQTMSVWPANRDRLFLQKVTEHEPADTGDVKLSYFSWKAAVGAMQVFAMADPSAFCSGITVLGMNWV